MYLICVCFLLLGIDQTLSFRPFSSAFRGHASQLCVTRMMTDVESSGEVSTDAFPAPDGGDGERKTYTPRAPRGDNRGGGGGGGYNNRDNRGGDRRTYHAEANVEKVPLEFHTGAAAAKPHAEGTAYIMCSSCKTSYEIDVESLGEKGMRMHCGVCDKQWFQSSNRHSFTDNQHDLFPMTEERVIEIQQLVEMRNWPKYPKNEKIGIFVGNLPYEYAEDTIGDLFAEYGITGISLVRDPDGLSKGFAFVEVSNMADAQLMIDEMHHFHADEQRKLTVRLANRGGGSGGGRGRGDGGGRGRGDGGGRGRSNGERGGGGGGGPKKVWNPR